ncbi:hypothetical protein Bbelb_082660 [Branchiostoma belcheri]|nr:hypothetical protein Bbelb_082660 [Branchiostoma belcheri]
MKCPYAQGQVSKELYLAQKKADAAAKKAKSGTVASKCTVRRTGEFSVARATACVNEEHVQLEQELWAVSREDLMRALRELQLDTIRIPTGHLLAATIDLRLTWNQTRNLKRMASTQVHKQNIQEAEELGCAPLNYIDSIRQTGRGSSDE